MSTLDKPELGQIARGQDIGKKGDYKFIWKACEECGAERWVPLFMADKTRYCRSCGKWGRPRGRGNAVSMPLTPLHSQPEVAGCIRLLNKICGKRVKPAYRIDNSRVCRYCGTNISRALPEGNLCVECRKVWSRRRVNGAHPFANSRRIISQRLYPERQECEIAGCDKLGIRHHEDYEKPEDIIWLCQKHHMAWHKQKDLTQCLIIR